MSIANRTATPPSPRKRRRPEEAEKEILDAAHTLLRERPWEEFTVDGMMSLTGLSRASFYVYFRDRADVMSRLAERLREELDAALEVWRQGGTDTDGRAALEGMADVYRRHGKVLGALQRAAPTDPEAERVYRWFAETGIEATAKRIRRGIEAGMIVPGLDPDMTARALCTLNARLLLESVGTNPDADAGPVIDTLATIYKRTLYGDMS